MTGRSSSFQRQLVRNSVPHHGIGIIAARARVAQGYATLGQIGFADRSDYTPIGTVCNLAARLCAEAKDGQILLSGRVAAAVEEMVALEELGSMALKGITQPVSIFNVLDQSDVGGSAEVIPLQRPGQQPR